MEHHPNLAVETCQRHGSSQPSSQYAQFVHTEIMQSKVGGLSASDLAGKTHSFRLSLPHIAGPASQAQNATRYRWPQCLLSAGIDPACEVLLYRKVRVASRRVELGCRGKSRGSRAAKLGALSPAKVSFGKVCIFLEPAFAYSPVCRLVTSRLPPNWII